MAEFSSNKALALESEPNLEYQGSLLELKPIP